MIRISRLLLVAVVIAAAAVPAIGLVRSGAPCGGDCAGYPAGYAFARRHAVADERECRGHGDAFWQGCAAYIAKPAAS